MATVKYSLDRETTAFNITKAVGSAVTKKIELTVEDSLTKEEIVLGLQKIQEYVTIAPKN